MFEIFIKETMYGFKLILIDNSTGGTHEKYNVIFNSDCQNIYFSTEDSAFSNAIDLLINN